MAIERWQIDPSHSGIHFSVRHLVIAKVRGTFARWNGAIEVPEGDLARGSVQVVIDASSIETGVGDRDAHLKSPDFFDVAQFPELTFTATGLALDGPVDATLVGQLTIKGVTKPVTLKVERHGQAKDPWGNERIAFSAKASLDRRDFGLTWNQALETGGVLVGDRVELEVEVEAVRQSATKVA